MTHVLNQVLEILLKTQLVKIHRWIPGMLLECSIHCDSWLCVIFSGKKTGLFCGTALVEQKGHQTSSPQNLVYTPEKLKWFT